MFNLHRNKILAPLALTGIALLTALSSAREPARTPRAAAGGQGSAPLIGEGPGGRSRLGRWILRTDPADRGLARGWQRGSFGGAAVNVPNVVSARFSGRAGVRNYEGSVAWYRTTLQVPSSGRYALDFQSANFLASVWVDGHALGSHRGFYLPFEMRTRLSAGAHRLVVRIDWRDPEAQARQGFHRTWFNWGGLGGEVDVRPLGRSELSAPTAATTLSPDAPDAASATVKLSVEVRNYGPRRTLAPQATLAHGAQLIAVSFPPLALAHGQLATDSTTVRIASPALWSPSSPNLYMLTLTIGQECSYAARIGLRQLSWHGARLYLNGRRLLLHGATIQEDAAGHGDALTPADENTIVAELRAIGANAARAQHPLDAGLLERLDAAGILVWQGIGPVEGAGNWYSNTPRLLAGAEQQARTAARAAALHPSIFAWNLVDELASNGHDSSEVSYVLTLTRWLHAHDPTRLVGLDVWGDHPPSSPGAIYSGADAIAETDYTGWYSSPRAGSRQLRAQMRARLARMKRTFPGRVLLISEFGAESNTLNASPGPGSYAFQSRLLTEHIAVYRADPQLSGMFIWVLRDYPLNPYFLGGSIRNLLPQLRLIEGLNQKGLFTYGGRAKPAVSVVRGLFGALGPD